MSGPVGSLGGLVALRDGLCHLAGCHLLDPESGDYTLPWIERVLPGAAVEVIRLVHREQGLIVAPGNPAGVAGLDDLPRLRYVNRQRGAGTRVLLDHELAPGRHRPPQRSTATTASSRPTSPSPPRSPPVGRTPASA